MPFIRITYVNLKLDFIKIQFFELRCTVSQKLEYILLFAINSRNFTNIPDQCEETFYEKYL